MPDSSKIKILYVIPSLKFGGAEIQLLSLVRGLDQSLFDITVAVFYQGNELDAEFDSLIGVKTLFFDKKHALDFSFLSRLKNVIKTQKFDIVQAYNISARLFAIYYARRFKVPFIIATERTAKPLVTSVASRIYLFAEKFALRKADLVITNSGAGRNYVQSLGVSNNRIHVIYNGIDKNRIQISQPIENIYNEFNIPSDAYIVGMSARIQEIKDPFTFVDIAALLKNENIYFLLVGDGPILDKVRNYAAEKKVHSFIFTGHRHDIADLVNALDVFVLTSNTIEGCSNALIEALALGVPAVVTHIGGNSEVVRDGEDGFLFPPGNAEKAAECVLTLINDEELYAKFSCRAKSQAEHRFSQTVMVAAYQQVYQSNFY